jgi:SanA protein
MKLISTILKAALLVFVFVVTFTVLSNIWVVSSTRNQLFNELNELPNKQVTLVLGTSKRLVGGQPNPFFEHRMDAAARLFHEGKTSNFLLSGDNRERYYNEPKDMKQALLDRGVPEQIISLDDAGLRTYDSILRCHEIFGQDSFIIVTQEFHAYRALFISNYYGLNAVAYTAAKVDVYRATKVNLREVLARPKAVIDIYILKKLPPALKVRENQKA